MSISEGRGICVNRVHLNRDKLIIKFLRNEGKTNKIMFQCLYSFITPTAVREPQTAQPQPPPLHGIAKADCQRQSSNTCPWSTVHGTGFIDNLKAAMDATII